MSMKRRIMISTVSYAGLAGGAFIFGATATTDMQLIHFVAIFLIMIGGYATALNR